jgi:hypothetical protein
VTYCDLARLKPSVRVLRDYTAFDMFGQNHLKIARSYDRSIPREYKIVDFEYIFIIYKQLSLRFQNCDVVPIKVQVGTPSEFQVSG